MPNESTPPRSPEPGADAPAPEPAVEPDQDTAGRRSAPPSPSDECEIDIVDFQSMQSFPASDPPAWPASDSEPATKTTKDRDNQQ